MKTAVGEIASYTVAAAPENQATATIWDNDAPGNNNNGWGSGN